MQPATAFAAQDEASAACTRRPIDLVHLSKFTMGRRDLEAEILGLFRQQLAASLARLAAAAADAGNDRAWREAAHTLKGSARGVGAWALGDACQKAETLDCGDARLAVIAVLDPLVTSATRFIDELLEDWHG